MAFSFTPARAAATALIFLGTALGAAAIAPGCTADAGTTPEEVCPAGQANCQVHLTLLHTSDIHSRLFDYDLLIAQTDSALGLGSLGETKTVGGIARVAYVINRERARADRVLHLDSGDIFQGAPIFNYFHGEPEVRAMSQIFPDAMVIGNHEYDQGAFNVATQFMRWADFPVLGGNYDFYSVQNPASTRMAALLTPFKVFTVQGLKVAVIGMGNLSTLGSLFSQPNGLGMVPLNTAEVAQTYIDLLRPYVDVVVMLSHLGLDADQQMVRSTTGIDIVLGGHNHIVINPPQNVHDCTVDAQNPGYVWAVDPNLPYDPNTPPPAKDPKGVPLPDPINHPYEFRRECKPRNVIIEHSGAFSKYVGRDDLILSNDPAQVSPTGNPKDYDPNNGFEVISNQYTVFPIDTTVPQDPVMVDLLQPYKRGLDVAVDLDILVGFSPTGSVRTAPQGGDAPLGNLVATAMWLRLGVQTDFALTNTTGIRTDMNPGPVTIEEMFNIFPFNNAITKMQLSGLEVQELFDYVAQYSQGRGCVSQAQVAGARVRVNCSGCTRPGSSGTCVSDNDCVGGKPGSCQRGQCNVVACADQIYIGHRSCHTDGDCGHDDRGNPTSKCVQTSFGGTCQCKQDSECGSPVSPGICDLPPGASEGTCSDPIALENLYELATSDYLAGGGSGYRVLRRNTTQQNTYIQQRDALTDYLRQGLPCGAKYSAGTVIPLPSCTTDADCAKDTQLSGAFVCACAAHSHALTSGGLSSCTTDATGCPGASGKCVRQDCRDLVAQFHDKVCNSSPARPGCLVDLNACSIAGEECKFLSCVDGSVGNLTDNRMEMVGR